MTDARLQYLIDDLRERVAFRAPCDRPDVEAAKWFAGQLAAIDGVRADELLRARVLAEHLTGVKG